MVVYKAALKLFLLPTHNSRYNTFLKLLGPPTPLLCILIYKFLLFLSTNTYLCRRIPASLLHSLLAT